MSTRFVGTVGVSIPEINHEVRKLPTNHECSDQFLKCFRYELNYCITRALRATEGQVVFSDLQIPSQENGQYVMTFEVFDGSMPRSNSYNFHGQNTSQWIYAGCILYQDGRVSTHH